MTRTRIAAALVLPAAVLAACGGGPSSAETVEGTPAATPAGASAGRAPRGGNTAARGATVKVASSRFGRILVDGRGRTLYLFDRERTRRSECYGDCAKAWPPFFTGGRPAAGRGARGSLLGTTKRRDGRSQGTYKGHPLYYYTGEKPGQVLCHNVDEFGGLWLVVKPTGDAVR